MGSANAKLITKMDTGFIKHSLTVLMDPLTVLMDPLTVLMDYELMKNIGFTLSQMQNSESGEISMN